MFEHPSIVWIKERLIDCSVYYKCATNWKNNKGECHLHSIYMYLIIFFLNNSISNDWSRINVSLRYSNTHPKINLNISGSLSCHKRFKKIPEVTWNFEFTAFEKFFRRCFAPFSNNKFFFLFHYCMQSVSFEMPAVFSEVCTITLVPCNWETVEMGTR
jgi:hypothetical protein